MLLMGMLFCTTQIIAQSNRQTDSLVSAELALSQMHGSKDLVVLAKQIKRIKNFTFVQQTLNYAPLSYASPPFSELGSSKKGYILSADISPNFVIGGKWMPYPIHITTRYKVRIFKDNEVAGDHSLPVRTPSFMPGATVFIPLQRFLNDYSQKLSYLSFAFFHHSDGQDGNEFNPDGKINLYNGNFSTNYLELAYHTRKRYGGYFKSYDPGSGYNDLYGRLGYEHHIGTAEPLKSSYGDHRINFSGTWINVRQHSDEINKVPIEKPYLREFGRVILNTSFIASKRDQGLDDLEKRINAELNFHWRVPSSPNTSLFFGGGYYGSDPYNIYYQQSYGFARIGVALGFFVAPNMLGMK